MIPSFFENLFKVIEVTGFLKVKIVSMRETKLVIS